MLVQLAAIARAQAARQATPSAPPTATADGDAAWEELDREWSALAPAANLLVAEIVDGHCVPIHALNATARLAIGSTFKLYILGELANQVRGGEAGWDDPLAVRDEWKASFSGAMNQLAAGEERTLREFAAAMISVSDNTATDHLLFHLGRERVEAIQAEMGHGEPAVNQPMLSTQELFQLKLAASAELRQTYLAAAVDERRRLLEEEVAPLSISFGAVSGWTAPIRIDELEWFASAEELFHAMATLDAWSAEPGLEPIREIISINPGMPSAPETWTYVGFKGGSEPGVLNLTWVLHHVEGGVFVVTGGLNNSEVALDEAAAVQVIAGAIQLLAGSVS